MIKMTKTRFISVVIGLLAIIGLVGPYIFGTIFDLVVDYVPDMVKVIVSLVFLVVNAVTIKFKGNKVWSWVAIIASIVVVSFWMDAIILGWIAAWKNCSLVSTSSVITLAISGVVYVIDVAVSRKSGASE